MKCGWLFLVMIGCGLISAQEPLEAFDLDKVVKHFEDLYRSDSSTSVATLTVTRPRRSRTLKMQMWTLGEEKALIRILEPVREKGTATLKVDKNLWNFLPKIKRTIRIPPSLMLGSWMGSDFTNDDLVRESSFRNDYTYGLKEKKENGWLIEFKAKPDIVGLWERIELLISLDGQIPIESNYYDRKNQLSRTVVWDTIKTFGDRTIPARMTLTPVDQPGHSTVMEYEVIEFDIDVPESTFSLQKLEEKR